MFVTANIFIQYNPLIYQSPESGIEDDSSDSELNDKITYKIGKYSLYAASETVRFQLQ